MKLYNAGQITLLQPRRDRYRNARALYRLILTTSAIVTALYFLAT